MFQLLFQYPPTSFQSGQLLWLTQGSALWFGVALIIAAVVIGALLWRQRSQLSATKLGVIGVLQWLTCGLVLWLLFQPILQLEVLEPSDNRILVLVDRSSSMAIQDENGVSRINAGITALQHRALPELGQRYPLLWRSFADDYAQHDLSEQIGLSGTLSDLGQWLPSALSETRQQSLGAVILLSDGAANGQPINPEWLAKIQQFGVPVHTLGVGQTSLGNDAEITAVYAPQTTIPNVDLLIEVHTRSGVAGSSSLKVYDGERILASSPVNFSTDALSQVTQLQIPSGEEGLRQLRIQLDPITHETNVINNQRQHLLTVNGRERRVLYLEGEPRWEYKFIRRAVEAGNGIHLSTVLRTSPSKIYRQGIDSAEELIEGFPTSTEALFQYDALIIGSQEAASFSPEQHAMIKAFVAERGGSLLMLGGRRGLGDGDWQNTEVVDVLPVRLDSLADPTFERVMTQVAITDDGRDTAWLNFMGRSEDLQSSWDDLPQIADFQTVGTTKPGSRTLLMAHTRNGERPLLVSQRYGAGKALVFATGGSWRWQMQLPFADQTHEVFWQNLMLELVSEAPEPVRFSADSVELLDRDQVTLSATILRTDFQPETGADVTLTVTDQQNQATELPMSASDALRGEFQALLELPHAGMLQLDMRADLDGETIGNTRLFVQRRNNQQEYFATEQNRDLLQRIADTTGGQYWQTNQVDGLADAIRLSRGGITRVDNLPLWSMPINFLLLLLLKMSEWGLRRYWGRL